jgi:8-oxo-dGTP pyrophosphatase MutT (NUDIX family)
MDQQDILFKLKDKVFSYRVAGVLIRDGKVLLQRAAPDPGYAFPGGHVNFGETSQNALVREFKEEIAADIVPLRLLWIGENFFPWGQRDCHQIGLYYLVALCDEPQIPLEGIFYNDNALEFSWISLADVNKLELYPITTRDKLLNLSEQIEQFVFLERPFRK